MTTPRKTRTPSPYALSLRRQPHEPCSVTFKVRVTPTEARALRRLAVLAGQGIAEILRRPALDQVATLGAGILCPPETK